MSENYEFMHGRTLISIFGGILTIIVVVQIGFYVKFWETYIIKKG